MAEEVNPAVDPAPADEPTDAPAEPEQAQDEQPEETTTTTTKKASSRKGATATARSSQPANPDGETAVEAGKRTAMENVANDANNPTE
jgi:hypothetical protein